MNSNVHNHQDAEFEKELEHFKEEIQHEKKEVEHLEKEIEELESGYKDHHKFDIIVNAEEKKFKEKEISFKQVIELAFGPIIENGTKAYTVTYKNGPHENPEGSMVSGQSVKVKNKMRFNATQTHQS